jgi:uncharacterized protein HemX
MIKDYSGNFKTANTKNKKRTSKGKTNSRSNRLFSLTKMMWNTIGAMLLVTLVIGISSTFWYGWQIQMAWDDIGNSKAMNLELSNLTPQFTTQRDNLLSKNHMEKTARKLGLYPPTAEQIRYP